ncbi:MAG: CDP-alcohol phosphatidyltransferase family protein [Thermoleophilia bacterium]|nr:CDP-alcohol phosphatidyltransferase family protein [Thermoleophilia bacterium]
MSSTRAAGVSLAQLPNALTIARLVVLPVFVVLLLAGDDGHSWPAAIVFAAAGITDQVDGFLARRWQVESAFGKIADPLADRLLIDAAVLLLWLDGRLPWVALAIVLGRDAVLLAGYKAVVPRGYDFAVNTLGRASTVLLYSALALTMATGSGTAWPLWLFWIGVAVALAAGLLYVRKAWRKVVQR